MSFRVCTHTEQAEKFFDHGRIQTHNLGFKTVVLVDIIMIGIIVQIKLQTKKLDMCNSCYFYSPNYVIEYVKHNWSYVFFAIMIRKFSLRENMWNV